MVERPGGMGLHGLEPANGEPGDGRDPTRRTSGGLHQSGDRNHLDDRTSGGLDALSKREAADGGHVRPQCGVPDRREPAGGRHASASDAHLMGGPAGVGSGGHQTTPATSSATTGSGEAVGLAILKLRFRNPNQQCYVNSAVYACLYWLRSKLAQVGTNKLLQGLRKLQGLESKSLHHIASLFDWRSLMQGWSRPAVQHDVTEFLMHILRQGERSSWVGQWQSGTWIADRYELEDTGWGFTPLHVPGAEESYTLQQCLDFWHRRPSQIWGEQTACACIASHETHVCFALQRFRRNADVVTRYNGHISVERRYMLPVQTTDGVQLVPFMVQAMILHMGERADMGHYRTLLWFADDVSYLTDDGVQGTEDSQV